MKGGAWKHQRTYVLSWIDSVIQVWDIYTSIAMASKNPESFEFQQEMEDDIGEAMEELNMPMPNIQELLDVAEEAELKAEPLGLDEDQVEEKGKQKSKKKKMRKHDTKGKGKDVDTTPTMTNLPLKVHNDESNEDTDEEQDLDELLHDVADTPTLTSKGFDKTAPRTFTSKEGKLEVHDESDIEEEADYEESFASQREAAQIREDMEGLSTKIKGMEETIKALLREREGLPSHLASIREDVNSQLTLMLDKLNASLESDLSSSNVQAAISSVRGVQEDTADRLNAAASYASGEPRMSSPLTDPKANLKGKRRFKAVK